KGRQGRSQCERDVAKKGLTDWDNLRVSRRLCPACKDLAVGECQHRSCLRQTAPTRLEPFLSLLRTHRSPRELLQGYQEFWHHGVLSIRPLDAPAAQLPTPTECPHSRRSQAPTTILRGHQPSLVEGKRLAASEQLPHQSFCGKEAL